MEFTADKTWVIVIACVLGGLLSLGLLAVSRVLRVFANLLQGVWSPSELTDKADGPRIWLGGRLPARCRVRSASLNDRREPLRERRSLRGWQSDGR